MGSSLDEKSERHANQVIKCNNLALHMLAPRRIMTRPLTTASRRARTTVAVVAAASLVALLPAGAAFAADNSLVADFDSFSVGDPVGQNGWGTHTSHTYDFEIVDEGGKALRLSNPTVVAADYNQMSQLYAPRLVEPAGESTTGATNDVFEMSFTFESSTGALQPGLNISIAASGERSDGAQPQNRA